MSDREKTVAGLYLWRPWHWLGHSACCWGRRRQWSGTRCRARALWPWQQCCLLTPWTLGGDRRDRWARTSPGNQSPASRFARRDPPSRWWPHQLWGLLQVKLGKERKAMRFYWHSLNWSTPTTLNAAVQFLLQVFQQNNNNNSNIGKWRGRTFKHTASCLCALRRTPMFSKLQILVLSRLDSRESICLSCSKFSFLW